MSIVNLSVEPDHIPTLADWHHNEWAYLNPGGSLQKRIAKMQGYLGSELVPSTFIYKQDGVLAGSAAIVVSDMDSRPELTPWLASVFVAPEFRRQGIGSRLVEQVMTQARQAGIDRLYLFTPDRADFYQKLGWTPMAEEMYRGHSVTVMQVSLHE
ncbi:MAG: GNAT family N-acetyltransferase [Methylococcaceae bacterium]|nr:GNAT family N-acetyltransferase [Methylococcaceae bacterium]